MSNLFSRNAYPEGVPSRLVAGDRWAWKQSGLTDYPSASYSLRWVFRSFSTTSAEIAVDSAADGTVYYAEVAAATTAGYTAGWYAWQLYVVRTSDNERVTISQGRVEVIADRDTATSDPRNHNRLMLDALESLLQGKATRDQLSYSIGDRSLSRMGAEEIQTWYDLYRRRVAQDEQEEQVEQGKGGGRRVRVRLL